jgi:nucleotide-binding universal stress UspA family protein
MSIEVILVASDFGDPARNALDWAIDLARDVGARIVLAHVFDLPIVGLPDAAILVGAQTAARLSDEAQSALGAEVRRVESRGVRIEPVLRQGDPRELVPVIAGEVGARLVVVGSHGRTGVLRGLLGSVAEDIMRRSGVPVTVVHAKHPGAPQAKR